MGKFDRYPGKAQLVFPEQMIGTYYLVVPSGIVGKKNMSTDTLFYCITQTSVIIKDSTKT